jgi:FkbM family methyltransferase
MKIEKVNNLWVPSDDIHIEQWKTGQPFTQNKCLNSFIEWCKSQHKTFRTVLDIGAWCGTWSLAMAEYSKKIHSFEPDKTHFTCLTRNVSQYVHIDPKMIALGDNNKETVALSADNFTQSKRVIGEGSIQLHTVDEFSFEEVDLIKIDVEGFEMKVLKGAENTLKQCQFLMIELNNNSKKYQSSNIEIENYLNDFGFRTLINIWPDKVFVNKRI